MPLGKGPPTAIRSPSGLPCSRSPLSNNNALGDSAFAAFTKAAMRTNPTVSSGAS